MSIDELWDAVCRNDQDKMKAYYENGGETNLRYPKFRTNHSLIMGAFRNGNYDMCELLISYGETVTPEEELELDVPKLRLVQMLGLMEK